MKPASVTKGEMRLKAKWLSAIVLPAAMILGITAAQPGAAATSGGGIATANWAGYAAVAKSGGAVTSFKYTQAMLTVPALNCTSTATGVVSQLVFLGDTLGNFSGDNSVGASESCQNGSPSYTVRAGSPCNGHDATLLTVSPGDTVKVVVTSTGVEMADDLTTNMSASNPLGTPCGDDSSVGVLTAGGFGEDIANFTQAGFRQIQVQGSNQSTLRPLASSAWNVAHYVLKGSSGHVDVHPEALLSGTLTSAFANDWLNPN
jgi:Peptidase A4 family